MGDHPEHLYFRRRRRSRLRRFGILQPWRGSKHDRCSRRGRVGGRRLGSFLLVDDRVDAGQVRLRIGEINGVEEL